MASNFRNRIGGSATPNTASESSAMRAQALLESGSKINAARKALLAKIQENMGRFHSYLAQMSGRRLLVAREVAMVTAENPKIFSEGAHSIEFAPSDANAFDSVTPAMDRNDFLRLTIIKRQDGTFVMYGQKTIESLVDKIARQIGIEDEKGCDSKQCPVHEIREQAQRLLERIEKAGGTENANIVEAIKKCQQFENDILEIARRVEGQVEKKELEQRISSINFAIGEVLEKAAEMRRFDLGRPKFDFEAEIQRTWPISSKEANAMDLRVWQRLEKEISEKFVEPYKKLWCSYRLGSLEFRHRECLYAMLVIMGKKALGENDLKMLGRMDRCVDKIKEMSDTVAAITAEANKLAQENGDFGYMKVKKDFVAICKLGEARSSLVQQTESFVSEFAQDSKEHEMILRFAEEMLRVDAPIKAAQECALISNLAELFKNGRLKLNEGNGHVQVRHYNAINMRCSSVKRYMGHLKEIGNRAEADKNEGASRKKSRQAGVAFMQKKKALRNELARKKDEVQTRIKSLGVISPLRGAILEEILMERKSHTSYKIGEWLQPDVERYFTPERIARVLGKTIGGDAEKLDAARRGLSGASASLFELFKASGLMEGEIASEFRRLGVPEANAYEIGLKQKPSKGAIKVEYGETMGESTQIVTIVMREGGRIWSTEVDISDNSINMVFEQSGSPFEAAIGNGIKMELDYAAIVNKIGLDTSDYDAMLEKMRDVESMEFLASFTGGRTLNGAIGILGNTTVEVTPHRIDKYREAIRIGKVPGTIENVTYGDLERRIDNIEGSGKGIEMGVAAVDFLEMRALLRVLNRMHEMRLSLTNELLKKIISEEGGIRK